METELKDDFQLVDGIVMQIERRVKKTVRLDDLIRTMNNMTKTDFTMSPVLPCANGSCKLYAENSRFVGFVIQCNPSVWDIRFNPKSDQPTEDVEWDEEDGEEFIRYSLSMPWQWFLCRFWKDRGRYQWNSCFVAASYSNIETMDSGVYYSPMPNMWSDSSQMCTAEITRGDEFLRDDPGLMCRKFFFSVPQCLFNDDLTGTPALSVRAGVWADTLAKWDKATEENAYCALNESFGLVHYGTFEHFVGRSMSEENR